MATFGQGVRYELREWMATPTGNDLNGAIPNGGGGVYTCTAGRVAEVCVSSIKASTTPSIVLRIKNPQTNVPSIASPLCSTTPSTDGGGNWFNFPADASAQQRMTGPTNSTNTANPNGISYLTSFIMYSGESLYIEGVTTGAYIKGWVKEYIS